MGLVTGCPHEWRDIQIHSKIFGDFLASSWNGKVDLLQDESEDLYDIVLENPDYANRRKKRSNTLRTESSYPTFVSLNLDVYLSPSWNVSFLIMYFSNSSTYPSSIYSWSISHILEHAIFK